MSSESQKQKQEGEAEKVFVESRAENFPNVAADVNLSIQKAKLIPNRKSTAREMIDKLPKTKDKGKF